MAIRGVDLVVDSFAWVEYFRGSPTGKEVDRLLSLHPSATPTIVLAELSDKYAREGISGFARDMDEVDSRTMILPLDRAIAEESGRVKAEARKRIPDFPLADGIVYASAKALGADVLTGDPPFRGWKGVVFLGE